jgi:hypothetical protein
VGILTSKTSAQLSVFASSFRVADKTRAPRTERNEENLSADQHAALKKLMDLATPAAPADAGADRFTYRIEVQDENGTKQVAVPESAVPASLAEIATH